MAGALNSDPLFIGLTRPPMIFGVSIKYAALNMIISMSLFIQSNSIWNLFVAFVATFADIFYSCNSYHSPLVVKNFWTYLVQYYQNLKL